ncbi:type II toxin-antitoxin system death-on-curing family toxin [Methylobacillus methanolivorans]|uniref:Type II toxin-antitoxin system death-on-curing family toxin n=1 Tax=Methylobacillus methanolivorans TaxID=1848927 RepID=A0ABW8GNA5_9PROT
MSQHHWIWIPLPIIIAVHDEQLAEHGGLRGIRDQSLLESALARPEQLAAYSTPDAAALAAAYGYGIAQNHPFADGNKRSAFVATLLFLRLNGRNLAANDADKVLVMLDVAAGNISEDAFADWIRRHSNVPT